MEAFVYRILEEKFEYERGQLTFSSGKIQGSIEAGKDWNSSFMITGPEAMLTQGQIFCEDVRMECLTPEFRGEQEDILFCFHAELLEPGSVHTGHFCIVSNRGEYELPYEIRIERGLLHSSVGPIENLFQFLNLAQSDFSEATQIFYDKNFVTVFEKEEHRSLELYRGFSGRMGNAHNVDEFLVALHKKRPIEIIAREKELHHEKITEDIAEKLLLELNGWGYLDLQIDTEGDFLSVSDTHLHAEDFEKGTFLLQYDVSYEKLHAGNNFGKIILRYDLTCLEIPVIVSVERSFPQFAQVLKKKKQLTCALMECYSSYRLKKINMRIWMQESEQIVKDLRRLDEQDLLAKLYQVQLLITKERVQEAGWELEQVYLVLREIKNDHPELWSYYLYLFSLLSKDEELVEEADHMVWELFEQFPDNIRIGWLYLHMSDAYDNNAQKKWQFLEEVFHRGSNSTLLYLEAASMVLLNASFLQNLDEFELQVIRYLIKNQMLTPVIYDRICTLCENTKDFSQKLLTVLSACYAEIPSDDLLKQICAQLIKGNRVDEKSFCYYALAVNQQLRITRLFEYYMDALPLDRGLPIPRMVMMYFSFHSDLSYERNAYLYRYVGEHREEFPEIFEKYIPQIEHFVIEQLEKGRIDEHLAWLYNHFLKKEMLTAAGAGNLSRMMFAQKVLVSAENIRRLIIVTDKVREETERTFEKGSCIYPAYLSERTLFLEKENGDRYLDRIPCQITQYMHPGDYAEMLRPYIQDNLGLDAYLCFGYGAHAVLNEELCGRAKRLAELNWLCDSERKLLHEKILDYYYENDLMSSLDEYLEQLDGADFIGSQKFWEYCVNRGKYEKVLSYIMKYGCDLLDPQLSVRLCCGMLLKISPEEMKLYPDDGLMHVMMYTFMKGKRQETIIKYLVLHYGSSLKNMIALMEAAMALHMDAKELCEKILLRILWTGELPDEKEKLVTYYMQTDPDYSLLTALLCEASYRYFVKGQTMETYLFQILPLLIKLELEVPFICGLAYVQNFADRTEAPDEEAKKMLAHFLWEQINQEIVLPCYREFVEIVPRLARFMDKSVVLYRHRPNERLRIEYRLESSSDYANAKTTESMKQIYEGVYMKAFVLFYGETLQYHIYEGEEENQTMVESGTLTMNRLFEHREDSRFGLLNEIMVAQGVEDYEAADQLLEEYCRKDYLISRLFCEIR